MTLRQILRGEMAWAKHEPRIFSSRGRSLSWKMYQLNGFSKVNPPTKPSTYCLLLQKANMNSRVEELTFEKPFN